MIPFYNRLSVQVHENGTKERCHVGKPLIEQYVHGTTAQKFGFRKDVAQLLAVIASLEEVDCDFDIHCRIFNTHYVDLAGTVYVWSEDQRPIVIQAIREIARIARRAMRHDARSSAVITHAVYQQPKVAA